jgi:hypothetical protein
MVWALRHDIGREPAIVVFLDLSFRAGIAPQLETERAHGLLRRTI